MLEWPHSGFHVRKAGRLTWRVTCRSRKLDGPTAGSRRGTHVATHIPDRHQVNGRTSARPYAPVQSASQDDARRLAPVDQRVKDPVVRRVFPTPTVFAVTGVVQHRAPPT